MAFGSGAPAARRVTHPANERRGYGGQRSMQCFDHCQPKIAGIRFKCGGDFFGEIPQEGRGVAFRPPGVIETCVRRDGADNLALPEGRGS